MKKSLYKYLFLSLFFASCAAQTPPKLPVLQKSQFYLRYVAEKRELQVEARLVADTGTVCIKDSFFINSKNSEAEAASLTAQRYKNEFLHKLLRENITFSPPYLISFLFANQRVKHILNAPQIQNLRLATAFVSTETGGLLVWEGQPFGELDAVHILITDAKGQTYSLNHTGKTRSNELPLPAAELKNLAKGQATLQLSFQHNEIQREGAEVQKIIEYYCPPVQIVVR